MASVTKIKVAPDRDIRKVQKFLDKNQDKFEKIDPSRVLVGMNAVARFSEDGLLYRCRVTKISKERVKVKDLVRACSCVIFYDGRCTIWILVMRKKCASSLFFKFRPSF